MKEEEKIENRYDKERFSVELTINENIVCQRYFKIINFKNQSLFSTELSDTIRDCVRLIQDDLKDKTRVYLINSAPQVFDNKEEMDEYLNLVRNGYRKLEVPSLVLLSNDETSYVWNSSDVEVYDKYVNRYDYVKDENNELPPCVLKFTFSVDKRVRFAICWDGNEYPRFVRTNIDLTNSKNKYRMEGNFSQYDAAMIDLMNKNRQDLITKILNRITEVCSYEDVDDYTLYEEYGDKTYVFLDTEKDWE